MASRPEVRWLWNGDLQPETLIRQLAGMRDRGYRSVVVWPWAGLEVPFLSRVYLDRLYATCEAALRQGVALWLADDVNWPSGTAAGRLLERHPEFAQRVLVCTSRWVPPEAPRGLVWRGEGEKLVAALAVAAGGDRRDVSAQLESNGYVVREPRVSRFGGHEARWQAELWEAPLELPRGGWLVTIATVVRSRPLLPTVLGSQSGTGEPGTLDVLNPAAVRAFIALTLGRFAATVGHWFGRTVQGIVTVPPEAVLPHAIAPPAGWRADVLPWTPDLPDLFRRREGETLAIRLPYLTAHLHLPPGKAPAPGKPPGESAGPSSPFAPLQQLAAERVAEAYRRPYTAWCEQHRLRVLSIDPSRLPTVPYTLRADRKRSVPPRLLAGVSAHPPFRGRAPAGSPDAVAAKRPAASIAANAAPAAAGPHARRDASWRPLDVLLPLWSWQPHSLNVHPLDGSDGHPQPIDAERFTLHACFEADYLPPDLALFYEAGTVEALTLNGIPLVLDESRVPTGSELEFADPCARWLPVGPSGAARLGLNALEATIFVPRAEQIRFFEQPVAGPVVAAGSFALRPANRGHSIVRPRRQTPLGTWSEIGYPRFSGSATYRQSFVVPELPAGARARVVVEAHGGTIWVELDNRHLAGPAASPCTVELTGHLRPGAGALAITVESSLAARIAGGEPAGLASVRLEYRV
ncbi:MAG: hypothetical protein HY332_16155 [Chloroflexi bacterium]|nr:hypothetical protein [Chloroflexota bacterium]